MAEASTSRFLKRAISDSAPSGGASNGSQAASPKAQRLTVRPRWRDPRLAVGVTLMAVSVVVATVVVSGADQRVTVWGAAHDLAAGTTLTSGDLLTMSVDVTDPGRYVGGDEDALLGRTLGRDVGAGELLAVSALGSSNGPSRLVTLPVEPLHSPPDLVHGDRVDVYVSARESADPAASRQVLDGALVSQVTESERATGELAVVLEVDTGAAPAVVSAGRSGVIDLVRVPVGTR